MVKSVDTADLKFASLTAVPVRFRLEAPHPSHALTRGAKKNAIPQCHNATFGGGTGGILFAASWSLSASAVKNPYESTLFRSGRNPHSVPSHTWEDLKSLVLVSFYTPTLRSLCDVQSKPALGNPYKDSFGCDSIEHHAIFYVKNDSTFSGGIGPKKCGTEVAFLGDFYPCSLPH